MLTIQITKPLHGTTADMTLDIDLQIEQGSFVALSGVSGSGKTTLLRVLAGLEEAKGQITMGETAWLQDTKSLPPQKRGVGFVFQDYALFANMTVEQNLLYVHSDKKLADKLLSMVELDSLRDRLPQTLSGGQQQRVALARALMGRPRLLLLDEPLSALDPTMRTKLQQEILALHREFDTTTLMVSHEPSEIYRLAQRVVVLDGGNIISDGLPKDVLLHTSGSQKFSFEGEILDIIQADVIYIAIVAIGQQIVEVVLSSMEVGELEIGDRVTVSTKAYSPTISKQ